MSKNTISTFSKVVIFFIIAISTIFSSCKKEYTEWPYNAIEKFAVKDQTGQELKALIQNETILISWPPFQTAPDSISPEIVVSDRALILPASGTKVPLKDGLNYVVTAQDGSKKTYTLKLASSQPKPSVLFKDIAGVAIGESTTISGEYFLADTNQTSLHLVDKNKKEIKMAITRLSTSVLGWTIPTDMDTGKYVIKFKTGVYTFTKDTIHVLRTQFRFTVNAASISSVKRGGELILDIPPLVEKWYANEVGYANVQLVSQITRVEVTSQIGQSAGVIKFGIPSDLALAQIQTITIFDKKGVQLFRFVVRPSINVTD